MDDIKISNFQPMDEGKPDDGVALYLFDVPIDGRRYGAEIPAVNAKEAGNIAKRIGAILMGRITDERLEKICPVCAGEFPLESKEVLTPSVDDWPDEI